MTKPIIVLACVICLACAAAGQPSGQTQFSSNPDGFKGFLLNETTVDKTIKALGQPDADKVDKLDVSKIGKWLDAKHNEKVFRQLTYRKSPDFLKVELSYLEEKLVMIDLEFKKEFKPEKLQNLFGVGFALLGGPATLPDKPGQYPIAFFATTYPSNYSMVGISDKTFIFVNCASGGEGSSPGRVERTRQVSRVLEKR